MHRQAGLFWRVGWVLWEPVMVLTWAEGSEEASEEQRQLGYVTCRLRGQTWGLGWTRHLGDSLHASPGWERAWHI